MGPIWGIAMNVKKLTTIMGFYMRVLQCMYKKVAIKGPICEYACMKWLYGIYNRK
jgi:hypothetical protein